VIWVQIFFAFVIWVLWAVGLVGALGAIKEDAIGPSAVFIGASVLGAAMIIAWWS
jgi:hypothetical protein